MLDISSGELMAYLPRPLTPDEETRLPLLIKRAEDLMVAAFQKRGRNMAGELISRPWLKTTAINVACDMVAAAILIGANAGVRSAKSTTGQESDEVVFANPNVVSYAGVKLTGEHLEELGLADDGYARGYFPTAMRWPERRV